MFNSFNIWIWISSNILPQEKKTWSALLISLSIFDPLRKMGNGSGKGSENIPPLKGNKCICFCWRYEEQRFLVYWFEHICILKDNLSATTALVPACIWCTNQGLWSFNFFPLWLCFNPFKWINAICFGISLTGEELHAP